MAENEQGQNYIELIEKSTGLSHKSSKQIFINF